VFVPQHFSTDAFQMFDIASLPAEAQAIVSRHQIQVDERLHVNRSRLTPPTGFATATLAQCSRS
jgi:hypothetical protein